MMKYFDEEDHKAEEKVIEKLSVEHKDNFYEYYNEEKEPCKYCEENYIYPIYNTRDNLSTKREFFPGWNVYVADCNLELEAAPDTYEPGYMEATIKINYCPMCGRKLNKEEE